MQIQRRTDTTFACPLVGRRDLERRQAMHRDKIHRMGSSIDTRAPAPQPHLTLYGRDYVAKKRATTEAAFSDLKMIQSIAKTMTRKPEIPERKGPVSLNADARKTEIFRIMKENHRLLDRLETLEPVVSTTDLIRDHKHKQRYTILVSHSKRLAGEYDAEVTRIRTEDKAKTDAMNRSVHLRLTKYRMAQTEGSMSMPSLTPLAATDPTGLSAASPAKPKQRAKPVVTRPLGSPGGLPATQPSSSSKSVPPAAASPAASPAPADTPAAAEVASGARGVSFNADDVNEGTRSDWERPGGPTPHPKKINPDLYFEDGTPKAQETDDEKVAPLPTAAEAPAEAPAVATEVPAESAAAAAAIAQAPAQEFDPVQEQSASSAPQVGLAGTADAAAPDPAEQSYEDDFADATQNSMSKAIDESGTFEDSTGA